MNKKRVSKGFTRTTNALVWGYTLVEILVGLTIIGMVFGVGFASFRSFARRQSVSSAIRALKADLRLAQEQALAGKKPDSPNCNTPNLLDGYNFVVDSSSQYTIQARCTGGTVTIKQVNLDNLTISIPFPNPILFKVLGQGTNIAGTSQANLVVEEIQTGFALAIAALPSGDVSEIEVPSATPIPTATQTPTITPTSGPTPTPTNTGSPTPTNTRTPTPTNTITITPAPVPSGNIAANPTTCSIPFGQTTCSSTIAWSSSNASSVEVWIDNNPGNVFGTGNSGSKDANFIDTVGYWFYLKGAPTGGGSVVTLDSVFVAGTSGPTPTPTSTSTPTPTSTLTPTLSPTPSPTPSGPAWYASGWGYRKLITVSSSRVSGGANLTSFPILVSRIDLDWRTTGSGGHVGQADGGDILFTLVDGTTKIDHEIESYTAASGALVAWVEIPTLSASSNTQIYIYYGNASSADQWNPTGTWNSSYESVWHLHSDFADSTINNHDGTNVGSTNTAGIVGDGQSFDGNDYINTNYSSNYGSNVSFTWEGWFNVGGISASNDIMGIEDRGGGDNSEIRFALRENASGSNPVDAYDTWIRPDSGTSYNGVPSISPSSGNWHYAVLQRDGSTARVYLDGGQVTSGAVGTNALNFPVTLILGAQWQTDSSGLRNYLVGKVDEIRTSRTARSSGWITTTYNNLSSPSTFYSLGTEEPKP